MIDSPFGTIGLRRQSGGTYNDVHTKSEWHASFFTKKIVLIVEKILMADLKQLYQVGLQESTSMA